MPAPMIRRALGAHLVALALLSAPFTLTLMTGCAEETVTEAGGELQTAAVEPLWVELEQHVHAHLQAITLEALIQRAQVSGLKRPAHAPIVFAI